MPCKPEHGSRLEPRKYFLRCVNDSNDLQVPRVVAAFGHAAVIITVRFVAQNGASTYIPGIYYVDKEVNSFFAAALGVGVTGPS